MAAAAAAVEEKEVEKHVSHFHGNSGPMSIVSVPVRLELLPVYYRPRHRCATPWQLLAVAGRLPPLLHRQSFVRQLLRSIKSTAGAQDLLRYKLE